MENSICEPAAEATAQRGGDGAPRRFIVPRGAKTVLYMAIILLVALVFVIGCAGWFQERMIFFPDELDEDADLSWTGASDEVFVTTEDGARIHGLFFDTPGSSRGVVLYFHGNAGSVASWYEVAVEIAKYDVDVFLIDYRSYGKSRGELSEEGLYLDGTAAYDHLLERGYDPSSIVIHGRSLGSAVATEVARRRDPAALVLETPFTSLESLARQHYPFLAPRLLLRYELDNLGPVAELEIPIWVVHGTEDRIVPTDHGRRVYEAAASPWDLTIIDGGGHNDLMRHRAYHRELQRFFNAVFDGAK